MHAFTLSRFAMVAASAALASVSQLPVLAENSVVFNSHSFVNKGLVGVGRIQASAKDKYGETFGSFSAFTFQPGTWTRNTDGSYSGVLLTQPDRGYNAANTTNYVPRYNKLSVTFRPSAGGAQGNLALELLDSVKFTEADGTPMTALDPTVTGAGSRPGFPALPQAFNGRLSLDAEGIVVASDGSLWVSDEYGPCLYHFSSAGVLLSVVRPPEAFLPMRGGAESFSSNTPGAGQPVPSPADPSTGRQNNQGLEGLSLSPDGTTLFTLLQSATRQDGGAGGSSTTRHNTRLLAYDLTGPAPVLKGEYILQLPAYIQSGKSRIAAQSDLLALSNTQFLVLARDGNGRGTSTATSLYRQVLVYDISGATNIAGTAYDKATPVAASGVLAPGIIPAARSEFLNLNDASELAKFGLHNGPSDDANNLSEKWEALALVPAMDSANPEDYFLFLGNDNDFLTTTGYQDGAAYDAGVENDSLILVYRVSLGGRLINLSSRAMTGSGEGAHIGGFVIDGIKAKTLLIRGVGPALAGYGVSAPLDNPVLKLYDSNGALIASNDDWGTAYNVSELRKAASLAGAFALADGSRDSAILINLGPGHYSAHVTGATAGISLLEVYELP